jgi:hypothetical protein
MPDLHIIYVPCGGVGVAEAVAMLVKAMVVVVVPCGGERIGFYYAKKKMNYKASVVALLNS